LLRAPSKYGYPETTESNESISEQPDSKTNADERLATKTKICNRRLPIM